MSKKTNIKNSRYLIFNDASIQDAMEAITHNHRGCVVMVSRDLVVMGVLSDGDIRRAIIKGATSITPVQKVANVNFISVSYKHAEEDKENILSRHSDINVIPVIDNKNKLIDVIVRGDK